MGFIAKLFGGGKKESAPAPTPAPQVAAPSTTDADQEKLKRMGRASLITTSDRGLLGNANTSQKQLTA